MPDIIDESVTDAIADTNLVLTGLAPANAFAMLELAAAQSFGQLLHGAVHRQQQGGIVSNAAVAATCTRIAASDRPPLPRPKAPPVPPLPPVQPTPAELIEGALASAQTAIAVIRAQAGTKSAAAAQALAAIATDAAPVPAKPAPADKAPKAPGA
jgi:hypothetical protein